MGAWIKKSLCGGVYMVNGVPLLRSEPSSFWRGRVQTVTFTLEGNMLSISNDYDDLTNTESLIKEENYNITVGKNKKGITTRIAAISATISALVRRLDDRAVAKIVFAEPKASEENKAIIFEAIFSGLHNFTESHSPNHLSSVYVPWTALSSADMINIIERVLRNWRIL